MAATIRPLQTADAADYRECRLNALRLAPTAFSSSFESTSRLPDSFFEARATFEAHSFIYGAFASNLLIGTAGGFVDPEIKRQHIGYVVGMWVDPEFRGQQLARRLLEAVVAQFRTTGTISEVQLGVTKGNASALHLYESFGFSPWGEEPSALLVDGVSYDQIHMAMRI